MNILVEPNRAQVLVDNPPHQIDQTALSEVADGILRRLSNARHTAVGFNFAAIIEHTNAAEYLRGKFLRDEVFNVGDLKQLSLNFSYTRMETVLNLNYGSGTASFEGEDHNYIGIVITANYHFELSANLTVDAATRVAKKQIARLSECYQDFLTLIPQIFGLEEEENEAN